MAEISDLDPTDANNTGRWPENMAPSAVNDAGRAMEGYLARWFKDINGGLASSGSSNAFAVTSNRTISALVDGIRLTFRANHSITGAATLNLNTLGAKDIKRFNGSALSSGDIISGQPVDVIYSSALDDWIMVSALAALVGSTHADFAENAAPGDPAANTARFYAQDDGAGQTELLWRDSAGAALTIPGRADAAAMLTPTSLRHAVMAGRQHLHPWHPKAAGLVQGSDGALLKGSGFTPSRTTTGVYSITLDAAMDGTDYMVLVTCRHLTLAMHARYAVTSATVFTVFTRSEGASLADSDFAIAVLGTLA